MCLVRHCNRGRHCTFAHSKEEELYHPLTYKTRLCSVFPLCGRHYCPFAHFPEEVRDPFSIPLVRLFWGSQAATYLEAAHQKEGANELRSSHLKHQLCWEKDGDKAACSVRSPPSTSLAVASTASPSTRQSLPAFGSSAHDVQQTQNICNNPPFLPLSTSASSCTARDLHQLATNSASEAVDANQVLSELQSQEPLNARTPEKEGRAAENGGDFGRGASAEGAELLWSILEEAQALSTSSCEAAPADSAGILSSAARLLGPQASQMSLDQIELTLGLAVKLALLLQPYLQQEPPASPSLGGQQRQVVEEQSVETQRISSQQELQDALTALLQEIEGASQKAGGSDRRPPEGAGVESCSGSEEGMATSETHDAAAALVQQLQILSLDESAQPQAGFPGLRSRGAGARAASLAVSVGESKGEDALQTPPAEGLAESLWQAAPALYQQAVAAAFAAAASREASFDGAAPHGVCWGMQTAAAKDLPAPCGGRQAAQVEGGPLKSLAQSALSSTGPPGLAKSKRATNDFRRLAESAFPQTDALAAERCVSSFEGPCCHARQAKASPGAPAEAAFPAGCWLGSGHSLRSSCVQREQALVSQRLQSHARLPSEGKKNGVGGRPQFHACFDGTFSESCSVETKLSPEMTTCAQTPPTATTPSPEMQDSYSPTAAEGIASCDATVDGKSKCLSRSTSPGQHAASTPGEAKGVIATARNAEQCS